MNFIVYILQSEKTNRYYVGFTGDLTKRLIYHNSGRNKSTKPGTPWRLIYQDKCEDKKLAWLRESQIKSYKGGAAFRKLVS